MTAQRRVLEAMAAGYPMYLGIDREWWCHGRRVPRRVAGDLARDKLIERQLVVVGRTEYRITEHGRASVSSPPGVIATPVPVVPITDPPTGSDDPHTANDDAK